MELKKPFLTYDEQIQKLEEKGLSVPNHDAAILLLKDHSYFSFISGYKRPFKNTAGTYHAGTSIQDIYALYQFDDKLRRILLSYILLVEKRVKSLWAYSFASTFGAEQRYYLDTTKYQYTDIALQPKINELVSILTKLVTAPFQHPYIEHQCKRHGNIPPWVIVKALTFGQVSVMYSLSQPTVRTSMRSEYSAITHDSQLEAMLNVLSKFRNVCAHNERLYDYRTHSAILQDTIVHPELNIPQNNSQYKYGKSDLFAAVIALKHLLERAHFGCLVSDISDCIEDLYQDTSRVQRDHLLKKMGFPHNWETIKDISFSK